MHLDEDRLQRLLDGELPAADEASVRAHLFGCTECRRRVAEARRETAEVEFLFGALDHETPPVAAQAVIDAARAVAPRPRDSWWARVAAGFAIAAILAGAAYAIPGSPLRGWVTAVVQWVGTRSGPDARSPSAPAVGTAGIAVAPGASFVIEFTTFQRAGTAHITLTDTIDLTLHAIGGAATFDSDLDRLVVDNRGSSAEFQIEIPRTAPRVEIRLGGEAAFLKSGSAITTRATRVAPEAYQLPLTPVRP
jgi:hypothetical protein